MTHDQKQQKSLGFF